MNILVLHGPNLNLIGVRSSRMGDRITLDKIDTALRREANELGVALKILQTHYPGKAITFLHRNRNWADGLIFSPGPWAKFQHDILDTLKLVEIPTIEIYFPPEFHGNEYGKDSIFATHAVARKKGHPLEVYGGALSDLHQYLLSAAKT